MGCDVHKLSFPWDMWNITRVTVNECNSEADDRLEFSDC